MHPFHIRPIQEEDKEFVVSTLTNRWGSAMIVSRGKIHDTSVLPGFVAEVNGKPEGMIIYRIENNECEILSLDSLKEGIGIGTALLEAVKQKCRESDYQRIFLITTNDNTKALRFYQKRGFTIKTIHPNALEESRRLKPEIPLVGTDGIPLRDEIELEIKIS